MEVDERPTEQYSDIGGLDQQIQEVTRVTDVNVNCVLVSTSYCGQSK